MFSRFVSTSALVLLVLLVPTSGRAQESSDELIEKFIEKIVAGKFEEANRYVLSAQCEDNELHTELILVANALLQRREVMREETAKLVGQEVAIDTKTGKKKGVLEEVSDEELVLKVQVKVGRQVVGESTAKVKWAELTYGQEERLSRTWEENRLALAVLWYSSGNAAKAGSCLNGARSPLGERLLAEIRDGDAKRTKPTELHEARRSTPRVTLPARPGGAAESKQEVDELTPAMEQRLAKLLGGLSESRTDNERYAAVGEIFMLAQAAYEQDVHSVALKAYQVVLRYGTEFFAPEMLEAVRARTRRLPKLASAYGKLKTDRERAEYSCFMKDDWEAVMQLAEGDDLIAEAAKLDLEAGDPEAIGDAWYAAGSKSSACYRRALRWYQQALEAATGRDLLELEVKLYKRRLKLGWWSRPGKPLVIDKLIEDTLTDGKRTFTFWTRLWGEEDGRQAREFLIDGKVPPAKRSVTLDEKQQKVRFYGFKKPRDMHVKDVTTFRIGVRNGMLFLYDAETTREYKFGTITMNLPLVLVGKKWMR